jgi:hypothetical protein
MYRKQTPQHVKTSFESESSLNFGTRRQILTGLEHEIHANTVERFSNISIKGKAKSVRDLIIFIPSGDLHARNRGLFCDK